MFNGNLINELIATVMKVEQQTQRQSDEDKLELWYSTVTQDVARYETNLLGVA